MDAKKVELECNNCCGNKICNYFTEIRCEEIRSKYQALKTVTEKRKFLTQCAKRYPKKKSTTKGKSRRYNTNSYHLPDYESGQKKQVCQKKFLDALGICEKVVRTALDKLQPSGKMEKDKRGGRQKTNSERDAEKRNIIKEHIKRFPRENSICCEKYINKECLCGTLNVTKMYNMFKTEISQSISCSLYRKVFKELNLSFYCPCNLCNLCKQITIKGKNNKRA